MLDAEATVEDRCDKKESGTLSSANLHSHRIGGFSRFSPSTFLLSLLIAFSCIFILSRCIPVLPRSYSKPNEASDTELKPNQDNEAATSVSSGKKNVLLIIIDDLRPNLEAYNPLPGAQVPRNGMMTPNIDELARKSLLFNKSYCQMPICNPSRASFLTGRRPDVLRIYENKLKLSSSEVGARDVRTLSQVFKDHGYVSYGYGKIFHQKTYTSEVARSFSFKNRSEFWRAEEPNYVKKSAFPNNARPSRMRVTPAQERRQPLRDSQLAKKAVQTIKSKLRNSEKPFFLAVGFHKPHFPLYCPQRFFPLYKPKDIRIPDFRAPPRELSKYCMDVVPTDGVSRRPGSICRK